MADNSRVVKRNGFDTTCGKTVLIYATEVPHHVRVQVINSVSSGCAVDVKLTTVKNKKKNSKKKTAATNSEVIFEAKNVSDVAIACAGNAGTCKGRYVLEFLD